MSTTRPGEGQSALSNDQLDELIEQQTALAESDPGAQRALDQLIAVRDQRTALEQQLAEMQERERQRGNKRLRAKAPTQRAINAAASFMGDPERVAAWSEAVEDARQADGSIAVTGRIVQLTIGAYFAERNRDKGAATTEEVKQVAVASDEVIEAATQSPEVEATENEATVHDDGAWESVRGILLDPSDSTTPFSRPDSDAQVAPEPELESPVHHEQAALTADDLLQGMMSDLSKFDFSALEEDAS